MSRSEKRIDRNLVNYIKSLGGKAIKLDATFNNGIPDRLCILPGGFAFFVEVKSTGEKPKKIQAVMHKRLRLMGFHVLVIDRSDMIKESVWGLLNGFRNG